MSDKTFYVTTPIYYVNARPHIGHAYTTIVADVLARRHRLIGEETFFLTGTDEHGQKIERSAAAANIPPQQFADQVSKSFEDLWRRMGITNNDYIRTTSEKHKRGVQHLFSELYKNGFIYLSTYTGAYCVSDEAFVDAPVGTPCPDCGRLLEQVTEENFFFKLSAFQKPLLDLIESNTLQITPDSRRNEILNFLTGNIPAFVRTYNEEIPPSEPESDEEDDDGNAPVDSSPLMEALYWGRQTKQLATTEAGTHYIIGALRDLSISRSSFTWGIPVPEDVQRDAKAAQNHVIYVWLDALANYITALGYGSNDETLFNKFWPANIHLVGKEIIRFHCVYWPAFLLALNPKLQHKSAEKPPELSLEEHKAWAEKWLPKAVTAHGWLLFEDSKMSKSKGNIVRTETILEGFGTLCPPPTALKGTGFSPSVTSSTNDAALAAEGMPAEPTKADRDLFATDILRYHLLREIPFGQDGSFSFDAMITRYNADLANGYGNLVSRTLTLISKTSDGAVEDCLEAHSLVFYQAPRIETPSQPERQEILSASEGQTLGWAMTKAVDAFIRHMDKIAPSEALAAAARAITAVDAFITSRKPWAATETELSQNGRRSTLYTAAESIRIITALLYPILPYATSKVWHQLGLGDIEAAARNGELTNLEWGGLKPGTKLGPLSPIFPRADKGLAKIMSDMENPTTSTDLSSRPEERSSAVERPAVEPATTAPAPAAEPTPETPTISIDDFAKIELRVAEIKLAERIPKADKLLRLEVDLGPLGQRQILSGIAEHYAPEDLIGRRIIVITNLAPRKMRGLESHGMLLAASEENGKPFLATVPEGVPVGTRLK